MRTIRLIVCAIALLLIPVAAHAQTAADSAGVLLGVATRLKAEGQTQLSRSLLNLILQRYAHTPAAVEAGRLIALRASRSDQSGRTELLVFGTTYGLFLGVAVPAAFGANEPEAYGTGLIAGGPAGFLSARGYARSRNITEGQARAISFGGTWGTWQGFGWSEVFDIGNQRPCEFGGCIDPDEPDDEARLKATILGGLTGIGVGIALSQKNITPGTATTVNFGGLWGSWYGGALAIMMDVEDGDDALAATLIGGNLGIVAAAFGAPKWKLSRQRARLVSISGVAGMLAGFGMLMIAQPDGSTSIAVPIATSVLGLALGARWTRNMEPERIGFLELPSMQPTVLERIRNGRPERVPALGITLLQARF